MVETRPDGRHISAVGNAFEVVQFLQETEGATLSRIADRIDRAESTTYQYLSTMMDWGYVVKDGAQYRLSFKFLDLGVAKRQSLELYDIIREVQAQLAEETDEITWYVIEEAGQAVFINKETGERAVQPYGRVGKYTTMHDIAAGKAILAHLPRDRVDEIIETHGLPEKTDATITDRDELLAELDTIRERGVSYNNGENVEGWRAVASPVLRDGELHGAIAVSGPEKRMQGERFNENVSRLVSGAANEIQLQTESLSS